MGLSRGERMKTVLEHEVSCGWCGAIPGEPCRNLKGESYLDGTIHRPRAWKYDGVYPATW